VRRTIALEDEGATQLGLYVSGSQLPPQVRERLDGALAARKELGALDEQLGHARERIADLAARAEELRENLRAVDKVRGADDLRKKLVADLAQVTGDADAVARDLGAKTEAQGAARARLQDALRDLSLDDPR
jgi:chromosome segregation ATPase